MMISFVPQMGQLGAVNCAIRPTMPITAPKAPNGFKEDSRSLSNKS